MGRGREICCVGRVPFEDVYPSKRHGGQADYHRPSGHSQLTFVETKRKGIL